MSRYQKGKTNLDFTEARDSDWQWNPLGHMQVCTSLQADNHASTPQLSSLQAGCPSCRPANSVKALKATPPPPNLKTILRPLETCWKVTCWGLDAARVEYAVSEGPRHGRLTVGDRTARARHFTQHDVNSRRVSYVCNIYSFIHQNVHWQRTYI